MKVLKLICIELEKNYLKTKKRAHYSPILQ